jgi:hypothetical protein
MDTVERNPALRIKSLRSIHTFNAAILFQDYSQQIAGKPDKNYIHKDVVDHMLFSIAKKVVPLIIK